MSASTPNLERRVLDLVSRVIGVLGLEEWRPVLLEAMQEAVPADWISLNDIGPDASDAVFLVQPPLSGQQVELFTALSHENPLLQRWLRTRDGRAYRFSDVATEAELRTRDLFRKFYTPLGIRYQIAFTLPSPPERVLAVALCRARTDFSDFERDLINRARPFLIESYRAAIEHSRLVTSLGQPVSTQASPAASTLTERQVEILRLVARGLSNAAVAARLGISARTVQKHLEHVYRKLGVRSRSEAAELLWR